jgi:hypothetical protein
MQRKIMTVLGAAALILGTTAFSMREVIFDSTTGTGFVGKGDVQLAFGWNNATTQQNAADVDFRAVSTAVTEVSWICTNSNNENTQERERTTTTSIAGVVDGVTRDRRQVTGFNLTGYDGTPVIGAPTTDGPPANSCPSGPWSLTTPAGDPTLLSSSSVLEAGYLGEWRPLN